MFYGHVMKKTHNIVYWSGKKTDLIKRIETVGETDTVSPWFNAKTRKELFAQFDAWKRNNKISLSNCPCTELIRA